MTISEMIQKLESLKEQHGDIDVVNAHNYEVSLEYDDGSYNSFGKAIVVE
jgi:hypothetical protein